MRERTPESRTAWFNLTCALANTSQRALDNFMGGMR
jgi:hypothetical protein